MTGPTVRDAGADDGPALRAVFRAASLANEGDRTPLEAHPDALEWPGPPGPPDRCRVAVAADGTVVGFATTTPSGPGLELVDLFVEPGRMRRGVGRALVEDVVGFASRHGFRRIGVDGNPHARSFYERVGFTVTGDVTTEFGPGLRMVREL